MSGPAYVVMPVNVGNSPIRDRRNRPDTERMAAAIQHSVYEQTHPKPPPPPKQEPVGPLKEILAHQDSLYKYISWEDPFRTLSSYVAALSLLIGVHSMPLTQWALKAGAYGFGTVAVAEFASRSFGPDTFLARLRPKPYKKVPERVLDATLRDIHDFVQYSAVQTQKIMFGEDLDKTFAAFVIFTSTYWLIKVASPFWLSVMGLTSLYIAPLVISPQARQVAQAVAQDTTAMAGDLVNATVDNSKKAIDATVDTSKRVVDSGKSFAQSGINQATEQSTKARDVVLEQSSKARDTVVDQSSGMRDTVVDQSSKARDTVMDQSAKARDTVVDASNRVGATASNLTGAKEKGVNNEKETSGDESNYVVDRKTSRDSTHSNSSVPRAVHPNTTLTPSRTEQRKSLDGPGVHTYKDPMETRVWPGRSA